MFITLPSYSGLDHPTHDLEDKADKTNSCSVCHGDPDCLILLHWVFVSMHKLLSCGVHAQCGCSCLSARGILVSLPVIEATPPALKGRFLTAGPPGSPRDPWFCSQFSSPQLAHRCHIKVLSEYLLNYR